MKTKSLFYLYLFLGNMLYSCGSGNTPIPRQYAYPRILENCEKYEIIQDKDLQFEINKSTIIEVDSLTGNNSRWLTLSYPQYNSKLFITINQNLTTNTLDKVLENRIHRFSLNIGSNFSEQYDVENQYGFNSRIFRVNSGSANPVMFLSTNNRDCIVSGTVYLQDMSSISKPDSISPIIDYVFLDIVRIANTLTAK